MTDEQLRHRANMYARQALLSGHEDPQAVIARAFVIGYANGLEDGTRSLRTARRKR